jgi:hypothetical protein
LIECRECLVDFEAPLAETDVIEGAFKVHPNLTITSGPTLGPPGTATIVRTDTNPAVYTAPSGGLRNNCLERNQGFSDVTAVSTSSAHRYQFDFVQPVTEFSVRLLDFGDFNPTLARRHQVILSALCGPFFGIADTLFYRSNPLLQPTTSADYPSCDLQVIGDACGAQCTTAQNPGNRTFSLNCPTGMSRVVMTFPQGHDPFIALDCLNFRELE